MSGLSSTSSRSAEILTGLEFLLHVDAIEISNGKTLADLGDYVPTSVIQSLF